MTKTKIVSVLLAMVFIFASCGSSSNNIDNSQKATDENSSTSSIISTSDDMNSESATDNLLKQADVLSEHLIIYSIFSYLFIDSGVNNKSTLKSDITITEISDIEIFRFIASTFIYADNIEHPYSYITETSNIKSNDYVQYALGNVQTVVSQLFNKNDWVFEEDYDESEGAYVIATAAGFGNNLTVSDVNSIYLEDINSIQTNITFSTGGIGEDNFRELGNLMITYDLIEENDKAFLRLSKIETV